MFVLNEKSFRVKTAHATTQQVNPVTGEQQKIKYRNGIPTNMNNNRGKRGYSSFGKKIKMSPSAMQFFRSRKIANKIAKKQQLMHESGERKMQLLDFNRKSYESSYNNYFTNDLGMTKSHRVIIKGLRFYDSFNNLVAEVEVEKKNEKNIITKFFVSSKYKGHGFAKDLLDSAKISLSANAVQVGKTEDSKERFFLAHDFRMENTDNKQFNLLVLNDKNNGITPKSIEKFDVPVELDSMTGSKYDFGNLYDTKGLEYDGYKKYI